jgi:hypothetical protein
MEYKPFVRQDGDDLMLRLSNLKEDGEITEEFWDKSIRSVSSEWDRRLPDYKLTVQDVLKEWNEK